MEYLKTCFKCKNNKPRICFHDRSSAKDGKRGTCKSCIYAARKERRICGIYKITSPNGKIYIGQSNDIKTRWSSYRTRECPSQRILNRSFIKYGVENHTFEIIEECLEEDLNKFEYHWQKFYNVVGKNGLNCHFIDEDRVYVKNGNGVRSKKRNRGAHFIHPSIIDVIDIESGVFYYSIDEASRYYPVGSSHFYDMIKGKGFNKTNCIKSEDYEKGLLPSTLFKPKEGKTRVHIKEGMEIVNFETKEILGDTPRVAKLLGIKDTTLRSYLNGYATNKTNLIYKKDLDLGLNPKNLVENYKNTKKW